MGGTFVGSSMLSRKDAEVLRAHELVSLAQDRALTAAQRENPSACSWTVSIIALELYLRQVCEHYSVSEDIASLAAQILRTFV